MNIHKLWAAMGTHYYGPEPICIEINNGRICVFTESVLKDSGQDGLYVSGVGDTLEEALTDFEKDLDEQLVM